MNPVSYIHTDPESLQSKNLDRARARAVTSPQKYTSLTELYKNGSLYSHNSPSRTSRGRGSSKIPKASPGSASIPSSPVNTHSVPVARMLPAFSYGEQLVHDTSLAQGSSPLTDLKPSTRNCSLELTPDYFSESFYSGSNANTLTTQVHIPFKMYDFMSTGD